MKIKIGLALLCAAAPAAASQVSIAPAIIYLNPADNAGYADLVVQSAGVRAGDGEDISVGSLRIDLLSSGKAVETRVIGGKQLAADTAGFAEAPVPAFIDGQLLSAQGLDGFFRAPTTMGSTEHLTAGQALVTTRQYFAVRGPIDTVRVTVEGAAPDSRAFTTTQSVPVQQWKSPLEYRSPVSGNWVMQSLPSLQSHHRMNAATEFAVDFMKVDGEGRIHSGDVQKAENYYGFGLPVRAAADGVVVRVVDGAVQDRAAMTRRPEEAPQAAAQRIGAYSMNRIKADFVRSVAGNLIVIKHEANGTIEYSSYGHLKAGIPVREGQAVKQGQVIALVGDTGDSPTVHLHFQVNTGPDPFTSASLPVKFADLRPVQGNSEPGRFIEAK